MPKIVFCTLLVHFCLTYHLFRISFWGVETSSSMPTLAPHWVMSRHPKRKSYIGVISNKNGKEGTEDEF